MPDAQPETLKRAIDQLMGTFAGGGGLHLLAAIPGGGKTRSVQELLADRAARGEPVRVLFAVRETLGAGSLGAEAAKRFNDLGLTARVIVGRRHGRGRGRKQRYADQFEWSEGPEVKVISHQHLTSMLCAKEDHLLKQCLLGASLVVIDEDPTSSLVLPGRGWSLRELSALSSPGRVAQALLAIAEGTQWHAKADRKTTIRKAITHRWTNTTFWAELHSRLGHLADEDVEAFA